mmetsp:Transcript_5219/g.8859  ORF Transcript_5219/g.8859 Transcript_5219/m.8859 type:complete len:86 (-) Transcript_5219:63-320(-)
MAGRPHELILLGNKIDIFESREVTSDEAYEFVTTHGLNDYREVSAKSGANVNLTFRNALTHTAYRATKKPAMPRRRERKGPPCCT